MKFSLIMPTIGRVRETERFLQSLVAQKRDDVEVIVVDQNADDRIVPLVAEYGRHFPILHLRETQCGLSHARNIALPKAHGEIVGFPDDDCVYPDGLLGRVAEFFDATPHWAGVVGRVYDLQEDANAFEPCGGDRSQEVDYGKAYKDSVSCALFFRGPVAARFRFDEQIGAGAGTPWDGGEETDFVFQCLDAGYRFYYDATLIVRHPNPYKKNNFRKQVHREYTHGVGKGYFIATHYLPPALLESERRAPYADALAQMARGKLRRAAYFLVNGIGTSLGYRAGQRQERRGSSHGSSHGSLALAVDEYGPNGAQGENFT